MRVQLTAFLVIACLSCASGCRTGAAGCPDGTCGGGLVGMGSLLGGGGFSSGGPGGANVGPSPEVLANSGYGTRGNHGGFFGDFYGQHHRGSQSHMGEQAGPADGPPSPTVTYPYYTTRGPRDFFLANPPSIGR